MTNQITAPWTDQQVDALNRFQREANMHPFTCGALHASGQSPVLEATRTGWTCPDPTCEYAQDWAHAFMADPDAWPKFPFGERHGPTPEEMRTANSPRAARRRHWLNDLVPVPRWAALVVIALAALQLVNWVLQGLLWVLIHVRGA